MAISERTAKIIWGQCAARCCICKKDVIFESDGVVASLIGEIAHIVGERPGAARGNFSLPLGDRNESENLLLLCRDHHKIIDDDPQSYPVDRLHQIKEEHISWIAANLVKPTPWRSNLSQLTYINVPRLCEQAELGGYRVDLSHYRQNETLHNLRWDLNHVMSAFQNVLGRLSVDAVPLQGVRLHEGFVGTSVSFERQRFRTKNVPANLNARLSDFPGFSGDLTKDPHVYCQLEEFRVVIFIDPRWITTSTAFTLFRPSSGQSTFSGLGRITNVDYEAGILTVTPWVIGLPRGPFEKLTTHERDVRSDSSLNVSVLDALVDMERARRENIHFTPSPTHCDLCGKGLSVDKYMIDGAVKGMGRAWACMCAHCFMERGRKIGWGYGQLYLRDSEGWLEVAGFGQETDGDTF